MPTLSTDLPIAQAEVLTAIKNRLQSLDITWRWHEGEQYADTLAQYIKLFQYLDTADSNKTKLRGGMVKHLSTVGSLNDGSLCLTPVRITFEIEYLMEFAPDKQSNQKFAAMQAAFYQSINRDDGLGYANLTVDLPVIRETSNVEFLDNMNWHRAVYEIGATLSL